MARRLGPAVITMIVVDAVLVAVLIALMVTAPRPVDDAPTSTPSASEPADPSEGDADPTTAAPAPVVTVPEDAVELAEFVSPSGNIWCTIADEAARCQIADRAYEVDPVEGCEDDALGQVVQVDAEGAGFPCPAGEIGGAAPDEREQLAYGEVSAVGDYMCTSAEEGMRCENVLTGSGFSLARADASTF